MTVSGKNEGVTSSAHGASAAAAGKSREDKLIEAWNADRQRFFEARDALYQFKYPPDPKLLREIADEIDCGNDCAHGYTEWDSNAHVCSRSDGKEGCASEKASCLRQFADAIDIRSRLQPAAASEGASPEAVNQSNDVAEMVERLAKRTAYTPEDGKLDYLAIDLLQSLARERERLSSLVRQMLGAIDSDSIDSEELPADESNGVPPYKWHQEWAYHARSALPHPDTKGT